MKNERGSISLVVAFMLPVLIGVAAFAVDIPSQMVAKAELQNAADAAALAGANALYRNGVLDWTEVTNMAQSSVKLNKVDQKYLLSGVVTTGYWNPSNVSATLQVSPSNLSVGDSPAVQVVISKISSNGNGELSAYFSKIWGIRSMSASATAVAGRTAPSTISPGYLFPIVITDCLFKKYWNTTSVPAAPLIDPATKNPYLFQLSSTKSYSGCNGGDWSSLDQNSNGTSTMRSLINNLNPTVLSIGDSVWVKPGVAASLFSDVNACSAAGNKKCEYVIAPVVANNYNNNGLNPILAFACIHITRAVGGSGKYIEVQMSNQCPPAAAKGVGTGYGVLSSPSLFH